MAAPRVMLATAFAKSKAYCRPYAAHVVGGMQGVTCSAWLHDDCPWYDATAALGHAVFDTRLGPWEGGADPFRYGRLARMRRELVRQFWATNCDYLYFHDVDTIPPYDVIPRLLDLDVPIASASYSMRGTPHAFPAWMEPDAQTLDQSVVTAAGYGMGCMLIRRDVLEQTEFAPPAWWEGKAAPGEDWQFTIDAGLPVAVDTRLSCWHACEDGEASRIEFGPTPHMDLLTVWLGREPVETQFGGFRAGEQRTDLTAQQQAALCAEIPGGFVCGLARRMYLEWASVEDILSGLVDCLADDDRRYVRHAGDKETTDYVRDSL